MEKQKPIHEIKSGRVIASIWQNSSNGTNYYSITFGKLYKDKNEDKWKTTKSFNSYDLKELVTAVTSCEHYLGKRV